MQNEALLPFTNRMHPHSRMKDVPARHACATHPSMDRTQKKQDNIVRNGYAVYNTTLHLVWPFAAH